VQRIEETRAQLRQDQYKDIDLELRRRQVELKTLELGNGDLERYYKALERALLRYHASKMENINQVQTLSTLRSPGLRKL
jgi:DNA repair protein RAD50